MARAQGRAQMHQMTSGFREGERRSIIASYLPLGRQHFKVLINSVMAAPRVVHYHYPPPPGPLSVSSLDFLALVFLPLILSCTVHAGWFLTRLTFLFKVPKQTMSRKFFSVTRPAQSGKRCQLLHFLWMWSSRPVHTLSSSQCPFESHDSLIKDIQVLFCRWFSEGPTVEFHSLIYARRVPSSTLKAELNEHF